MGKHISTRQAYEYMMESLTEQLDYWHLIETLAGVIEVTHRGYQEVLKASKEGADRDALLKILKDNQDLDEYWEDDDNHISCFAYPNCDVAPTGCGQHAEDGMEEFGHKG